MSQEDAKRIMEGLEEYVKDTTSSEESARAALVAAGLVKADGEPEEPYKA
ncbi:hypothetical protein [Photobacterium aquimaris]|nr:hypothetical protein [Photobacterium aquimaris]